MTKACGERPARQAKLNRKLNLNIWSAGALLRRSIRIGVELSETVGLRLPVVLNGLRKSRGCVSTVFVDDDVADVHIR